MKEPRVSSRPSLKLLLGHAKDRLIEKELQSTCTKRPGVVVDVEELVDSYLCEKTWLVRENANTYKTFTGLFGFVAQEVLKRYALFSSKGYPPDVVNAHLRGDYHIHDLPYARFIGYCAGWSLEKILRKGFITPFVVSRPAKHLSSAVDHVVNFIATSQQEWAGAQAFSDFDLWLAPFVYHDRLSLKEVIQNIQRLVFNFNFPSRFGSQSPFVNITLTFGLNSKTTLERKAIVGGEEKGVLGDYIEEAMMIAYAVIKILEEGDAEGKPFTFPIPTIAVGRDFDWNGRRWTIGDIDLSYEIFKLTAERGSFYFLNYLSGVINPEAVFAMCCHLLPDKSRFMNFHMGGLWAMPDETGSIGVVTINMPRIGYLAAGDDDAFFEKLDQVMELARKQLRIKRYFLNKILEERPFELPITKEYLGTFDYHYSTFGIIGMHEALMNFMGEPIWSKEGRRFTIKVLKYMLSKLKEFEEEDQVLYNLEQTPAESTSHRLAMLDVKEFGADKIHVQGEPGAYYYTNSTHIPYHIPLPLYERIRIESEFHPYFTGGVILHVWLGEKPEVKALKNFIYRVLHNTKTVYLTITPTITFCKSCRKTFTGVYEKCPACGSTSIERYSRIVGYYRPVSNWNPGKYAEYKRRVEYSIEGRIVKVDGKLVRLLSL